MDEAGAGYVSRTVHELYSDLHEKLREQVRDLDADALSWSPMEGANSIAVLVTHSIGSEREMVRAIRQVRMPRDRDAEFRSQNDAATLLEMIDAAERDLEEFLDPVTAEDLTELRARGDRPPRPGLNWLLSNYGHLREHLAQIELTRQLHTTK